jgi:hypothetical protein
VPPVRYLLPAINFADTSTSAAPGSDENTPIDDGSDSNTMWLYVSSNECTVDNLTGPAYITKVRSFLDEVDCSQALSDQYLELKAGVDGSQIPIGTTPVDVAQYLKMQSTWQNTATEDGPTGQPLNMNHTNVPEVWLYTDSNLQSLILSEMIRNSNFKFT